MLRWLQFYMMPASLITLMIVELPHQSVCRNGAIYFKPNVPNTYFH